jgi:DNA invertase Pin-like site-specific DNA recombinase
MSRPSLALALCRVSTAEQLENNSLNRQREAVLKAAHELGVTIPENGWWSGNVSSKRGTNLNRKDLNEIIARCKKDKNIKYLIVDEPDRFMRSIDEAAYFEVKFRRLKVTVWYASDPDLNKGDLASKLLKFTKYLSAEGSNEERQRKSITGQVKALQEGRYPFAPKPGYKRGYQRGIHEVHEVRGPILKVTLAKIANGLITPTEGLKELNSSDFMKGHSPYKMDKFRKIITDPFYAGIVEIDKQVKYRNENGLHEPLITKVQHEKLLKIMDSKKKTQKGPRKNGNPKYPLNNITYCKSCIDKRNGKFVGFDHTNGKPDSKVYERYRCRTCNKAVTRQLLHEMVEKQFRSHPISPNGYEALIKALEIVWKRNQGQAEQDIRRFQHKIDTLNASIDNHTEAITDPSNASIKDRLRASIERKEQEIADLEDEIRKLSTQEDYDRERFMRFAFGFIENMGGKFLEISPKNRLRCKQIMFPEGFWVDENKKVYTPQVSILITLATNKKDTEVPSISHMVQADGPQSNLSDVVDRLVELLLDPVNRRARQAVLKRLRAQRQ